MHANRMSWFARWKHTGTLSTAQRQLFLEDPSCALGDAVAHWSQADELNLHQGKVDKESFEGQTTLGVAAGCLNAVNICSQDTDHPDKQKKTVEILKRGILNANEIRDTGELLCQLHHTCAEAYYELKEFQAALEHAMIAVLSYPTMLNGTIILIKVLVALGDFRKAFDLSIAALTFFTVEEPTHEVVILKLAVSLATKVDGGYCKMQNNLPKKPSEVTWNLTVTELANEGSWNTVKILLFGTDDLPAIVTSLRADDIKLSGLVSGSEVTPWKQWGQKLTLYLLQQGADYRTICPHTKYPLHVALNVALKTDSYDLMKKLFAKHVPASGVSQTDDKGNTLLHVACLDKTKSKATAIRLLLNHDINIEKKNKAGKTALDLLAEDDPDRALILKKIHGNAVAKGPDTRAVASMNTSGASPSSTDPGSHVLGDATMIAGSPRPGDSPEDFSYISRLIQNLPSGASRPQPKDVITRDWSKTRIKKWLEEAGLTLSQRKKFREVDGPVLHELRILQDQCPEMFFQLLQETLQLQLPELLKVSAALRECGVQD